MHWAFLQAFGLSIKPISIEEARVNYNKVVSYCENRNAGYSKWKGVLIAADHLASAMDTNLHKVVKQIFIKPKLTFYNRKNELY